MPLLELRHVNKAYREPATGVNVPVLRDVSLVIEPGQSLAVTGPSGCGKSTLLNVLGTLDEPDNGDVLFDGKATKGLGPQQLAALRSGGIGFIFQLHHLLPQCTVLENVLLPTLAQPARPDPKAARDRAMELLKTVGLEQRAGYRPAQLSGGERQRAAVVRALINSPKMILADEPTGALDEHNAKLLTDLLLSLVDKFGIALVLVTHHRLQAERMQRMLVLHDGCLRSA
ncbi:ABC transporter [Verrucomicrobiaceae bacterium SCGC AG-212-N21]|nr:ABC transporter [Verrucomicrobiaceae bacterium SCGC AG-212-N21]